MPDFIPLGNENNRLPILIWDAADPTRVRLATRGADKIEDCEWTGHAIPVTGFLLAAGISPEVLTPREGEDLYTYMDRLFPLFLKALEEIWGPINTPNTEDALRLAAKASALEAKQREIALERWFAEGGVLEFSEILRLKTTLLINVSDFAAIP